MAISRNVLKGWTILVIDDEEDSLEVATRLLAHYGAEVCTAANGEEGWNMLKTHRPHFVISDISMPVMDGWTLIRKIKNDRSTIDIPVIALTAHAMMGDRERAMNAGFHNYLDKPLTPETFVRDLLRLLTDIPDFSDSLREVSFD